MSDTAMRYTISLGQYFRSFFSSVKGSRNRNEDNYLVITPSEDGATACWLDNEQLTSRKLDGWPSGFARMAVADGMGGHAGGREIAQAAVEGLMNAPPVRSVVEMYAIVQKVHSQLYERFATNDEHSPGTTLLVADQRLDSGLGILAHIGDSRAYELADGQVKQLTHDHTYEEFDWREGDISRQEYEKGLQRSANDVVQALGHGSFGLIREKDGYRPNRFDRRIRLDLRQDLPPNLAKHADVIQFRLSRGKALMLATDGLWNPSREGRWHGLLTNEFLSNEEVEKQISKARDDGSRDNITVVVFGYSNES
jgi:PPM family protein phosphatase